MTPTMEQLKRNVIKLRKAKRLTQKDLGKLANVTQSTVSLVEMAGAKNIPVSTVEKLALALEVSPADLLYKEIKLWGAAELVTHLNNELKSE